MLLPALSSALGTSRRPAWLWFPQYGLVKPVLPSRPIGSLHSLAAMLSQQDELTHGHSWAANTVKTTDGNNDRQDMRQGRSKAVPDSDETRQRLFASMIGHASVQCSSLPQASEVRLQTYVAEDKYLS